MGLFYDAAEKINEAVKGNEIKKAHLVEDFGKLTLVLDGGCLEIICNSAGYECYQLNGPGNLIIVGCGGNK